MLAMPPFLELTLPVDREQLSPIPAGYPRVRDRLEETSRHFSGVIGENLPVLPPPDNCSFLPAPSPLSTQDLCAQISAPSFPHSLPFPTSLSQTGNFSTPTTHLPLPLKSLNSSSRWKIPARPLYRTLYPTATRETPPIFSPAQDL